MIQWHFDDPVDDFEINRNEIVFGFQQNKSIYRSSKSCKFPWGEYVGENWNENLGLNNTLNENLIIYPNPSSGILNFNKPLDNEKLKFFIQRYSGFDKIIASSN